LYEKKTGILLSGDIIYDGPLIDDVYHSAVDDYVETLLRMRELEIAVVHGGHFPSFGKVRYRQLIEEYLAQKRQ
ncbi:MAG: MBL fold metallo-hydrolase, partial [Mesorhizobium sp.]